MPPPGVRLDRLGFLTIGLFDGDNPGPGHQTTLEIIELGERLGFDSAWVRDRHLQYGISSPVAILAAASQRTRRIELGTAVIPLGWENPLRLAEDLGTVDVLSGGRLNPGVSVGPPMHFDDVKAALYPDTADVEDFSYERVSRLLRLVGGEPASTFAGLEGMEQFSSRVQPHSPGLRGRMWYGGASTSSARWAGEQRMNFLTSSVVRVEGSEESTDFAAIQQSHIRAFRAAHPDGPDARVSQGLVVIPTDSATAGQRARYAAYVEARTPRTASPQGPARMMFARDLLGSSSQVAEALYAHAGFREVREVAFALPFNFEPEDYVQILSDMAAKLGPALGWRPAADRLGGTFGVMELGVGCAMWTHAPWQGRYLPGSLAPRDRLRAYATWCNAVEGNTTFYATPTLPTVKSWAEQTSPDFRFILKLPKPITHERRLADAGEPLRAFLTAIEPLGRRAHALWIQLPPSFSPAELGALAGFLRRLPAEYRYSVEVRHRAFFEDPRSGQQLERALGDVGAEWVTFDTTVLFDGPPASDAEREAWTKKPRLPRRSRALTSYPVVRYIGRDDAARTVAGWQHWLDAVAGWLREGRSPTVFIHTPDNVGALELARRFHHDVRARVPELKPLPEPVPAGPPTLF